MTRAEMVFDLWCKANGIGREGKLRLEMLLEMMEVANDEDALAREHSRLAAAPADRALPKAPPAPPELPPEPEPLRRGKHVWPEVPEDEAAAILQAVNDALQEHGIEKKQLAVECGINQTTISELTNNNAALRQNHAEALRGWLASFVDKNSVPVDEVVETEDVEPKADDSAESKIKGHVKLETLNAIEVLRGRGMSLHTMQKGMGILYEDLLAMRRKEKRPEAVWRKAISWLEAQGAMGATGDDAKTL